METTLTKTATAGWRSRLRTLAVDLGFILALLCTRGTLADHYYVPTGSMEPTLQVGDHLLVNKAAYGVRIPLSHWWLTHSQPKRGDVVVFEHPVSGTVMVKRLVGLPGDQLSFDGEHLFINGVAVDQRIGDSEQSELLPGRVHPIYPGRNQGPPLAPMTIPSNSYFMMGDHRGNSYDSRSWGVVPQDLLLGRAVSVIYSSRTGLSWGQRWWISLSGDESNFDDRLSK